jgi:uncharacterized membrane protein
MTQPAPAPPALDPVRWLNNQPYLLLSLTSLFWAGNIVLARHVAGHVPPLTLSCVRWIATFLILLPFAWPHLKQDWPVLRAHLPMMLFLSFVGFAYNNAISYWALQYTEALNALLIQSAGPLFVALWSLALFGIRLTPRATRRHHALARGRPDHHPARRFWRARQHQLQPRRPDVCQLAGIVRSLFGADPAPAGDACAVADFIHHLLRRADAGAVRDLGILDRRDAEVRRYLDGDAGLFGDLPLDAGLSVLQPRLALIGPNRAAPFFHLVPVFGSAMAILLLGEQLRLSTWWAMRWCWPRR